MRGQHQRRRLLLLNASAIARRPWVILPSVSAVGRCGRTRAGAQRPTTVRSSAQPWRPGRGPLSVGRGTVDRMAVVEHAPAECPNGHQLGPNRVVVGWHPCDCTEGRSGHRTYWCRECRTTMYEAPRTP